MCGSSTMDYGEQIRVIEDAQRPFCWHILIQCFNKDLYLNWQLQWSRWHKILNPALLIFSVQVSPWLRSPRALRTCFVSQYGSGALKWKDYSTLKDDKQLVGVVLPTAVTSPDGDYIRRGRNITHGNEYNLQGWRGRVFCHDSNT